MLAGWAWAAATAANGAEVGLAEALDTPGWVWVADPGAPAGGYGLAETGARGGAVVRLSSGSYVSTSDAADRILKVRYQGLLPSFSSNFENLYPLSSGTVATGDEGTGWLTAKVAARGAGEIFRIRASSQAVVKIDSVEAVAPPATVAEAMGFPADGLVTGGTAEWKMTPVPGADRYGIKVDLTLDAREAWLEIPVTGPAQVGMDFTVPQGWQKFLIEVDGKAVWQPDSNSSDAKVELPAGEHSLRLRVFLPAESGTQRSGLAIHRIELTPYPAGAPYSAALDEQAVWTSSGGWEPAGVALSHDGVDGLAVVTPTPRSAVLRRNFTGPGWLKYHWLAAPGVDGGVSGYLFWNSDFGVGDAKQISNSGWQESRIWVPAGGHWFEWQTYCPQPARIALDGISFTAAEVLPVNVATGAPELPWENDAARPWMGVVREPGETPMAIPGEADGNSPSTLAVTLSGPGNLSFRWRRGIYGVLGELRVNGKTVRSISAADEVVAISLPSALSKVEWVCAASNAGGWLGVGEVVWSPLPAVALAVALDAPAAVTWATPPEAPFKGWPDAGAAGGSSAWVELTAPDQESWLEATVEGPGIFDFWLRDVPGGERVVGAITTELFIDGVQVAIDTSTPTWPAKWITTAGSHHIRLKFRNRSTDPSYIAVDDVSWHPLEFAAPDASLTMSEPGAVKTFVAGGQDDGPQILIPAGVSGRQWAEKTVTGPGVLSWSSKTSVRGIYDRRFQLTIDGGCVLPVWPDDTWDGHRLSVPAGSHVVRWSCEAEEWEVPPADGTVRSDRFWQISNVEFTAGAPPLMNAVEDDSLLWLETGNISGTLVTGEQAADGVDAWELADRSLIYLCNPGDSGVRAGGRILRHASAPDAVPEWQATHAWLPPRGMVLWAASEPNAYGNEGPALRLDGFFKEEVEVISLAEALETSGEITSNGWAGIVSAGESFDGGDCAWSLTTAPYDSHQMWLQLAGPSKVSFRWKVEGSAALGVKWNGGWVPLPLPSGGWQAAEFSTDGAGTVEWVQRGGMETSPALPGNAWVDALVISPVTARTLAEAATTPGTGLTIENHSAVADQRWESMGYREESGEWREGARATQLGAVMRTTVTGPKVVSFRLRALAMEVPALENPVARDDRSVVVIDGDWRPRRSLSVSLDGALIRRITPTALPLEATESFLVPAGTHEVSWLLEETINLNLIDTNVVPPPWQAWVGDISLKSQRQVYDDWADGKLPSSARHLPEDDADGDGASNLLEYACGTDPADAVSQPAISGKMGELRTLYNPWMPAQTVYLLSLPYVSPLVDSAVESSPDLKTWEKHSAVPASVAPPYSWIIGAMTPDFFYYEATRQVLPLSLEPAKPKRFYRLKVTIPETP